jgi:uncharacterized metal-binding protein
VSSDEPEKEGDQFGSGSIQVTEIRRLYKDERRPAMNDERCCEKQQETEGPVTYEIVRIEKTKNVCPMCEDYARHHESKPVVVMCCEGACLRGEIARQAANIVTHKLAPDETVRLCLGGAFTKDTGQRGLVRNGARVIALEGCFLECASRMMKGAVPGLAPVVIIADRLYEFDRSLFGIDEMPEVQIKAHAETVATRVMEQL